MIENGVIENGLEPPPVHSSDLLYLVRINDFTAIFRYPGFGYSILSMSIQ